MALHKLVALLLSEFYFALKRSKMRRKTATFPRKIPFLRHLLKEGNFADAKKALSSLNPNDEGLGNMGIIEGFFDLLTAPSFTLSIKKKGKCKNCGKAMERQRSKVGFLHLDIKFQKKLRLNATFRHSWCSMAEASKASASSDLI